MPNGIHHPVDINQIAAHGGPKDPGKVEPHERDLETANLHSYRKPWERRRRARWVLAVAVVIALVALAGLAAFVDQAAKDSASGSDEFGANESATALEAQA